MCVGDRVSGPVSPQQAALIAATWDAVMVNAANHEELGSRYLFRLFEVLPEARSRFPAYEGAGAELLADPHLRAHGRHFMAAVALCVGGLGDQEKLARRLRGLGQRHLLYDTSPVLYQAVGEALAWTLKEELQGSAGAGGLGPWEDAWRAFYGFVSEQMQAGGTTDLPAPESWLPPKFPGRGRAGAVAMDSGAAGPGPGPGPGAGWGVGLGLGVGVGEWGWGWGLGWAAGAAALVGGLWAGARAYSRQAT